MDDTGTYTPARIDAELAELTHTIDEGRRAERLRASIIGIARTAYPAIYTQARLAELTGVSQQAVSKTVGAGRRAFGERRDPAYLLGRLMAVAVGTGEPELGGLDDTRAPGAAIAMREAGRADTAGVAGLRELTALDAARLDGEMGERFTAALADLGDPGGDVDLGDEAQRTAAVEGYFAQRTVLRHGRF
ncbi:hypothetical protein [Actinorhabdospora filicis]|nr:hypothetical protein [Actinorhabdospora filicis]